MTHWINRNSCFT